MARQIREREYTASDLKTLMDGAARWARSWDDVLQHLREASRLDSGDRKTAQLVDDVRYLDEHGLGFTTDYRRMWEELTGMRATNLPAPAASAEAPQATPQGSGKASSRVLDILQRVESKEYRQMAEQLESGGDAAWERQR